MILTKLSQGTARSLPSLPASLAVVRGVRGYAVRPANHKVRSVRRSIYRWSDSFNHYPYYYTDYYDLISIDRSDYHRIGLLGAPPPPPPQPARFDLGTVTTKGNRTGPQIRSSPYAAASMVDAFAVHDASSSESSESSSSLSYTDASSTSSTSSTTTTPTSATPRSSIKMPTVDQLKRQLLHATFAPLGLRPEVLKALDALELKKPTGIQVHNTSVNADASDSPHLVSHLTYRISHPLSLSLPSHPSTTVHGHPGAGPSEECAIRCGDGWVYHRIVCAVRCGGCLHFRSFVCLPD